MASASRTLYRALAFGYHQIKYCYEAFYIYAKHSVKIQRRGRKRGPSSSSQFGQELYLLSQSLIPHQGGFFVEVGANHPQFNSNTYTLEKDYNYSGIAVDPLDYASEWKQLRPNTHFINKCISDAEGKKLFCKVSGPDGWEDQLSTLAEAFDLEGKPYTVEKHTVETTTLQSILSLAPKEVDVLFIDVEGHEHSVLLSNDWEKYKPNTLVVENVGPMKKQEALRSYIKALGYKFTGRIWTCDDIYIRIDHA